MWLVVASVVACFSKPKDEELNNTLKREFVNACSGDPRAIALQLASKLVPADLVASKYIQDYVVLKVATVNTMPGVWPKASSSEVYLRPSSSEVYYIGVFNTWIGIGGPGRPKGLFRR